jgi:hypothetical protein
MLSIVEAFLGFSAEPQSLRHLNRLANHEGEGCAERR